MLFTPYFPAPSQAAQRSDILAECRPYSAFEIRKSYSFMLNRRHIPLKCLHLGLKKALLCLADSNLFWAVAPLSLSSTPPTPQIGELTFMRSILNSRGK
jgi:hypothetical protein